MIERWPDWPSHTIAIIGPEGSGKSHLAAIWAQMSGARVLSARALDTAMLPEALTTGALVLENCGEGTLDERALFHLLNLAREQEAYLLLTGRSVPVLWGVALPDLESRLRAVPAIAVSMPDDALLRADRQLAVDENLVRFLLARVGRSFAALQAAVRTLDREALQRKRPVNRALASELFRDGPK